MRAVKRLALWGVYGAGLMGARVLLGGEGVGLTRAVDIEKVLPCSAKGEAESMDTTSHFRMLPMSSCSGVYRRPLPTCSDSRNQQPSYTDSHALNILRTCHRPAAACGAAPCPAAALLAKVSCDD